MTNYKTIYIPKVSVHGFIDSRNIVSNAKNHCQKQYVINIDLKDFFHSITQKRIRGTLMAPPFHLKSVVSTTISHICCHRNHLPQGAPTSPIISNIICSKLDSELRLLAKKNHYFYTRYADDITFSTTRKNMAGEIGIVHGPNSSDIKLSDKVIHIINDNGFEININKVRIQSTHQRQEVTGLTVNKKVNVSRKYIRHVRAMLHDWHVNGFVLASMNYFSYCLRNEHKFGYIHKVLGGKINFIGQVRGKEDRIYARILSSYQSLLEREKIRKRALVFSNAHYSDWCKFIDDYLTDIVTEYISQEEILNEDIKSGFDELNKLRTGQDPDYDKIGVPVAYAFLYLPRKIMAAIAVLSHYFREHNTFIPRNILDIGSGTDAVSIALGMFRRKINISLVALEPNNCMRNFSSYHAQFTNLEVNHIDGGVGYWNQALRDNHYDLIFMSCVLQNRFKEKSSDWWKEWTKDLYTATKENAKLIVIEPLVKQSLINQMNGAMELSGWIKKENLFLSDLFPNVNIKDKGLLSLTELRNNLVGKHYKHYRYPVSTWNTHPKYDEFICIYQKQASSHLF